MANEGIGSDSRTGADHDISANEGVGVETNVALNRWMAFFDARIVFVSLLPWFATSTQNDAVVQIHVGSKHSSAADGDSSAVVNEEPGINGGSWVNVDSSSRVRDG